MRAVIRVILCLMVAGCGETPAPCTAVGGPALLVGRAALFQLESYGDGARCDGARLAPGAPAPLVSGRSRPGEPVELSVAPGRRVLVLTAFLDELGAIPYAGACREMD